MNTRFLSPREKVRPGTGLGAGLYHVPPAEVRSAWSGYYSKPTIRSATMLMIFQKYICAHQTGKW